jgi:hypothetical protein
MRLGVLLLIPFCLAAAETNAQRGKRVVMEALEALGGDRFAGMKDRVEVGRAYSFYRDELSGLAKAKIYTRYIEHPNQGELSVRERQAFGKDEEQAVLFMPDGAGWEVTFRGARPLAPDRVARYKDSTIHNVLYILHSRLKEPGLTFDSQGADVVDNMPVEIVDITDSENRVVRVYFHRSTKLPVRQVFYRRDPKTKDRDEEVTLFSKYRDIGGGVQWPFAVQRIRNGEKVFEMFADIVSGNQGLEDKLFELPSGAKKLKPAN